METFMMTLGYAMSFVLLATMASIALAFLLDTWNRRAALKQAATDLECQKQIGVQLEEFAYWMSMEPIVFHSLLIVASNIQKNGHIGSSDMLRREIQEAIKGYREDIAEAGIVLPKDRPKGLLGPN